jgi:hypothetical protein
MLRNAKTLHCVFTESGPSHRAESRSETLQSSIGIAHFPEILRRIGAVNSSIILAFCWVKFIRRKK